MDEKRIATKLAKDFISMARGHDIMEILNHEGLKFKVDGKPGNIVHFRNRDDAEMGMIFLEEDGMKAEFISDKILKVSSEA